MASLLQSYLAIEQEALANKLQGDPIDNAKAFSHAYHSIEGEYFADGHTSQKLDEWCFVLSLYRNAFKAILHAQKCYNREPTWEYDYYLEREIYGTSEESEDDIE